MIEIIAVHKCLSGQPVLRGITIKIPRGGIKVILGLSGSGKSVLMRHMIGLMRPDSGQILVDGIDITQLSERLLLQLRRKFGMVFQQSALFDSMTVFDNVAFPLVEHTNDDAEQIREKVLQRLALLGLHGTEHRYPSALSGGMRKRVALARSLMLKPSMVFYDEPTTGLDPITTRQVDEMILATKAEMKVTSLVISHDIGSAFRIADEIAILHQGQIVADGSKACIQNSEHPFVKEFLHSYFEHG